MADLYKILGVNPEDDATIIKRRYRELAMKLHPDRNGGDVQKTQQFQKVTVAYAILGNEQKRAEYDMRRKHPPAATPGSIFGPRFNDLVDKVSEEGITGENWSELFSDLFGAAIEFQETVPKKARKKTESIFGGDGLLDTLETLFGTAKEKK